MFLSGKRYRALTFDCYGTLIDWDGGIRAALRELPSLEGADHSVLLRERESAEHALLAGPFALYGSILRDSLCTAAALQQRRPSTDELERFSASMGAWPPFEDTCAALQRLGQRARLAILSNVETRVLQRSVERLGARFETLVTAEELRSYKPGQEHWIEALRRLRLQPSQVLHVAGSLHHDIRPARALGLDTVWINRRGEPLPGELAPQVAWPDLASFADAFCAL